MFPKLTRLIVALPLALFATVTFAEDRIALVIGNSAYTKIGELANPKNDALLIGSSLEAMGFKVTTLTDLSEKEMGRAVDDFATQANNADVAAVYFAGHGIQKDGENFLMPVDAEITSEDSIAREGISLDSITRALESAPVSLLFLDACRNNPFVGTIANAGKRGASVNRGLAIIRPVGDMLISFATLPNTTAADGSGRNSPYAIALARHMKTPNAEVSVLMKRVTADVLAATQGDQRPQQLSQMQTEFYFKKTRADAPVVVEKNRALLTVAPPRVALGDEVSVFADLPPSCSPFFFNFTPANRVEPIPQNLFKTSSLDTGQLRYEISANSRFGLVVTDQDVNGNNRLGYLCQPRGMAGQDQVAAAMKAVLTEVVAGKEDGSVDAAGFHDITYQVRGFEIYGN